MNNNREPLHFSPFPLMGFSPYAVGSRSLFYNTVQGGRTDTAGLPLSNYRLTACTRSTCYTRVPGGESGPWATTQQEQGRQANAL